MISQEKFICCKMLTSNANSIQGAVITGCAFSFQGMTVYIISHCFNETPKVGKNFSFPFMKKHWELWCWGKCKTNNKYIWSQGQGHHCPPQGDLGDSHAYERTRWKPWIPDTPWYTPWYLNFPWPKKKKGKMSYCSY